MIHHERLRPPPRDFPADEWNIIEKGFHPEFLAQLETMLAVGNGYLGIRGCPEEGGPNAENGTFINGFYESRPIIYGEEAYGLRFALQKLRRPEANCFPATARFGETLASKAKRARFSRD